MKIYLEKFKKLILENKQSISIFFALSFIYSLWALAFYPGAMSGDSWAQWQQIHGDSALVNHGPYLHTVYYWLIIRLWDNPVIISLFQIACTSLIVTFAAGIFREHRINKKIIYLMIFLYAVWPVIGIYNITLWRDVTFAQLVVLASVVFIKDYLKVRVESKKLTTKNVVILGVILLLISASRHNGIILLVFIPVLYFTYKLLSWKILIKLFAALFIGLIFTQVILMRALDVENNPFTTRAVLVHSISGIIAMGGTLDEYQTDVISELVPIENIKERYHCSVVDKIIFNNPNFNATKLTDNPEYVKRFDRAAFNIIADNLPHFFAERTCLFSYLMGLGDANYSYYYEDNLTEQMFRDYEITQTRRGKFTDLFEDGLRISREKIPLRAIFWVHLTYVLVFILALAYGIYKRRGIIIGFTLIYLINVGALYFANIARDFRYLYMLPLGVFILIPLVLLNTFKNEKLNKKLEFKNNKHKKKKKR